MKDWKEGVEYGISEAMNAKDKWEAFMLKIDEANNVIPFDQKTADLMQALKSHVEGCIETLKADIKPRL